MLILELIMDRVNTALQLEGEALKDYMTEHNLVLSLSGTIKAFPSPRIYPGNLLVEKDEALAVVAQHLFHDPPLSRSFKGKDDLELKTLLMKRLRDIKSLQTITKPKPKRHG